MRPSIIYSTVFPVDKTTESTCRSTEKLSRRGWPRLVSNLITVSVNMSIAILPLSQEFNWNSATVGLIHSSFFWGYLLTQVDSNIGSFIAILPMSQEFNWNSATVGLIHFSFFWDYLHTQILGGIWADKISGKLVLGFGVIWWSATTVLTPIAARVGLPFLFVMCAFMGIGEAKWFPQQLIFTHFSGNTKWRMHWEFCERFYGCSKHFRSEGICLYLLCLYLGFVNACLYLLATPAVNSFLPTWHVVSWKHPNGLHGYWKRLRSVENCCFITLYIFLVLCVFFEYCLNISLRGVQWSLVILVFLILLGYYHGGLILVFSLLV